MRRAASNSEALDKISELYYKLFEHDGFGEMRVEMNILKKGQKEVIIHCGKQYRFVVDFAERECCGSSCAGCSSCEKRKEA